MIDIDVFVIPTFDAPYLLLLVVIFLAGIARGLSGFGTGMIVAPVAGALYGPKAALTLLVLIDILPALPVTLPAFRIARWSEVVPILVGMLVGVPLGVWVLVSGDELVLRWLICLTILGCVAVLWMRWTWRGPRNTGVSLGIGGFAGVLSGIASIPGPPVIAYWMTAGLPAAVVRANLLTLFFLTTFIGLANISFAGIFAWDIAMRALFASPIYFGGIVVGTLAFSHGGERLYRTATFLLILLAALLALPLFDTVFNVTAPPSN
jgi:uncharacterized membrane protein YfcA